MVLFTLLLAACASDDTCAGDTAVATSTATSSSTSTATGTGTGGGGNNGGPGAPPENFFSLLTETGACGDLVFYANNTDDSLALVVRVDGFASEARAAEGELVRAWPLGETVSGLRVGARQGMAVSSTVCTDGSGGSMGGQAREWVANGGALEVAASVDASGALHAEMSLTDATFVLFTGTDTGTSTNTAVITGGDIAFEADVAE